MKWSLTESCDSHYDSVNNTTLTNQKVLTKAEVSDVSLGYMARKEADLCKLSFSAAQENCFPHTQNTVLHPSPFAIAMQQDGHDIIV